MAKRRIPEIHWSVKETLGYAPSQPDNEVMADWKERTRRVCKPCWELKYCPYGPFVEQSPLLPMRRADAENEIDRLNNSLATGISGEVRALSDEEIEMRREWLADEDTLLIQAWQRVKGKRVREQAMAQDNTYDLGPIEQYRVKFDLGLGYVPKSEDFSDELWMDILAEREIVVAEHEREVSTLQVDNRAKLDRKGRAFVRRRLREIDLERYPVDIPTEFEEAACSIFGHICPVFFTAEIMTETEEERRIGRHSLPFATMMRIVRRDDYRCQHCGKRLEDTEVEFDHIIPIAKGGSSEEHNIRLTCFDCNRDKSDDYVP